MQDAQQPTKGSQTVQETPNTTQATPQATTPAEGMSRNSLSLLSLLLLGVTTVAAVLFINEKQMQTSSQTSDTEQTAVVMEQVKYELPEMKAVREVIELPEPDVSGDVSLEEAIQNRRSRRAFSEEPVTMQELSQVLWAAQGITEDETGHRAAPSARGAYPFSLYVVVRNVETLDDGLYLYDPTEHTLGDLGLANAGERLTDAGVQPNSQQAPVVIALSAAFAKMQTVFPDSDPKPNSYLEAGHIGQNIYLQVEALEMATVVTGGFNKQAVAAALELDAQNEEVVYLVPFGHIGEEPEAETN